MIAEPPIRLLIVDDEPLAVLRLTALCQAIAGVEVIGSAYDGRTGLREIQKLQPELVLMDIAMPGISGLDVALALECMPQRPVVAFCTAYDHYAIAAFEREAIDYLLKPVTPQRLAQAILRVRNRLPRLASTGRDEWLSELWVPHRSEMIRLDIQAIDRFEAERDYVRLHVGPHNYLIHHTMSALEQRLAPGTFIRLHRSTIARKGAIARLRNDGAGVWTAVMADGAEQRVSRSFLRNVRTLLSSGSILQTT